MPNYLTPNTTTLAASTLFILLLLLLLFSEMLNFFANFDFFSKEHFFGVCGQY
jgi:hypothetical protein